MLHLGGKSQLQVEVAVCRRLLLQKEKYPTGAVIEFKLFSSGRQTGGIFVATR